MTRGIFILAVCLFVILPVNPVFAQDAVPDMARRALCKIFFETPEAFENEETEECDCIPYGTVAVCNCFDSGRQALTANGQPCLRDPTVEDPRHVKPLKPEEKTEGEQAAEAGLKTAPVRHSGRVYLKTLKPDGSPHSLSRIDGEELDIICPPGFGAEDLKPVM